MLVPSSRSLLRALVTLLLAPTLVLSSLLVASPAQAQRIKPIFWGMHDNDWTTPSTVPVGSANFTTSGTYWPSIQTGQSQFNWAPLTQQVEATEAKNAKPMIVLGKTPQFFSSRPGSADYDDYMPRIRPWRRYVTKVARKYGTRLDYQIWPEPNIEQNWKGSPRQMAKLTMVASKAIKRNAGRNAKVVSPAVALRLKSQRTWTVQYFKQTVGGRRVHRYVDAIAIDPFPAQTGTPEDSLRLMRTIRKQLADIGVRKPFWNNEINYGVAGGGETTSTKLSVGKQQSYVIRTYALSAAARMQRTYWLGWFSTDTMAVKMADSNGLALAPGESYAVVRSWLNKTNFVGCTRKPSGLWVCTAKKGRTEVRRIYWKPSGKTTIRIPRSTTKRVENQNGELITRRGLVRATFRPIMVASRR
jgi:hypothetical protein